MSCSLSPNSGGPRIFSIYPGNRRLFSLATLVTASLQSSWGLLQRASNAGAHASAKEPIPAIVIDQQALDMLNCEWTHSSKVSALISAEHCRTRPQQRDMASSKSLLKVPSTKWFRNPLSPQEIIAGALERAASDENRLLYRVDDFMLFIASLFNSEKEFG